MIRFIILLLFCYIIIINGQNCTKQNFPQLNCPNNQSSSCCSNITTCINTNTQISQCLIGNCTGGPCSGCDFFNASQGICFDTSIETCCNGATICTNVTFDNQFELCNNAGCSDLPCGFVDCDICGNSLNCGFNGTEMLCNGTFSGLLNTCVDKKDELSLCLTSVCICIDISVPIIPPSITPTPTTILVEDNNIALIIAIIVGIVAGILIIIGIYVYFTNTRLGFNKI